MRKAVSVTLFSVIACASLPVVAQVVAPQSEKTAPAASSVVEFDKRMALAQENMKKMQQQMDRIRQTTCRSCMA
jgi:hypothetical protein